MPISAGLLAQKADYFEALTAYRLGHASQIIDLLPAHPVIDAEEVARQLGIHPTNAHRPLRRLVDTGILIGGRHDKSRRHLYRSPELLQLLDDYAAEFGRRL